MKSCMSEKSASSREWDLPTLTGVGVKSVEEVETGMNQETYYGLILFKLNDDKCHQGFCSLCL